MPRPSMKKKSSEGRLFGIGLVAQNAARSILVQFIVQRLETDVQQFGRARLVVARLIEGAQNHFALNVFQRGAHGKSNRVFRAALLSLIERVRRKMMPLNLFSRTNHDRALYDVTQLANVTGPGMIAEGIERGRTDKPRGPVVLGGQPRNQMLSQQWQVL